MNSRPNHAIIVAGHAVLRSFGDPAAEQNWILLDFQRGEPSCYIGHIRCGVELAAREPGALLVFSGGQSRREAGPRSEAETYLWIARHYGWFGMPEAAARATTEEYARDSFENLLFGICRFRECAGCFPERVTFVSWTFKEARFELHREAIRWPKEHFRYVGANNPPGLAQALAAEQQTALKYRRDPYSAGAELEAKRRERNPFGREHPYWRTCPELTALFKYRGPELFPGSLPWTV
ncbi:MAG: hypothetical protein M1541_20865 [Acidobacteria bacterium]|nr:hypothetical protein [Acidobacteriota bacterium]